MDDIDTKHMTDKELERRESISFLIGVGCVLTVIGLNYILRMILPDNSYKARITYLADLAIVILFLSGYMLYSWKSDMAEFLKRTCLAIPLALTVLLFAMLLFGHISINVGLIDGGLFIFFLLLLKTPDRKQHFTVIITLALTALMIVKFSQFLSPAEGEKDSFLRIALSFVCAAPIVCFFSFYISKAIKGQQFAISSIVFKALKFSIVVSVFFLLFMAWIVFCMERGISFPIQILVSTLLSILFAGVCYRFDFFPIKRKKNKK